MWSVCRRRSEAVDGASDVGPRQARGLVAHVLADLGGQHDAVALAAGLEPVADDRFRFSADVARRPARVDVGGVDER